MIELRLNWNDKSDNEDKFIIERKKGPVFETVGEVPGNTETFTDGTAELNREYTYRVFASRFDKRSQPSGEVSVKAIGLKLQVNPSAVSVISVVKTGQTTRMIFPDGTREPANMAEVGDAGELLLVFDSKANVTNIDLGESLGIGGTIDLVGFGSLNSFIARNGSYNLRLDSTFVQRPSFTLDVTNSIVSAGKVNGLIDSIIIVNGGDLTDNGEDYTGSAGLNFAGRNLVLGTLTIDISVTSNRILFQKITKLEDLGWNINTVRTVCEKKININTELQHFAVTHIERSSEFVSLVRQSGNTLFVDLYDTRENAEAGTSTGRLSSVASVSGLQEYIDNNSWPENTDYYIRFFSSDTVSNSNASIFTYKAYPTEDRPCGALIDVVGFSSLYAYSTNKILVRDFTGILFGFDETSSELSLYDQNMVLDIAERDSDLGVVNNFIKFPNNSAFIREPLVGLQSEYAIGCYFYLENSADNNQASNILAMINNPTNISLRSNNGNLVIQLNTSQGIIYSQPVNDNQYYSTIISHSELTNEVIIYIDGIETYRDNANLRPSPTHFQVGESSRQNRVDKFINSLVIYNQTINSTEAQAIHNLLS